MLNPSNIDIVLVLGKSGVGKQSRIDVLCNVFHLVQISTGDLFRSRMRLFKDFGYVGETNAFWNPEAQTFKPDEEILQILREHSPNPLPEDPAALLLGVKATYYVDIGKFVPDALTNSMLVSALAERNYRGVLLDGYPRTIGQYEFLCHTLAEHGSSISFAFQVDWDDDHIVLRATGRRLCRNCQAVFHLLFDPPREGKYCTKCGGEVYQRSDDATEDKLRSRLREFAEKVVPLIDRLHADNIPFGSCCGHLEPYSKAGIRRQVLEAIAPLFPEGQLPPL